MGLSIAHDDPASWRHRTPGNIPYRVIGREGAFEIENAAATEVYLLRATDLQAFVLETFPAPILIGGQLRYPITRRMPGLAGVRTTSIKWKAQVDGLPIDPFSSDPNAPAKTYGELVNLTIEYETGKNNDDEETPETFLEISANATGEFIHTTAPKGRWEGDDEQVADPVIPAMVIVPEVDWSVRQPRIPWSVFRGQSIARMRSKLGKVNNSVIELLFNAPKETILFAGFSYSESYTWRDGEINTPPISIDMKFLEKHIEDDAGNVFGHQHIWRPGKGWQRLLHDGVGRLYVETDLNVLFKPLVDEEPADPPEAVAQLQRAIQNEVDGPVNPDPPAP